MRRGAIASGCPYSAQVGADILSAGGNAVDATVGAALTAAFTLPTMTGLGGGGVMTMRVDGKLHTCDFFAALPGLGFEGERRQPEVIVVPFEGVRLPFRVGRPSVAVPGAVAGLWAVHERFGRMPMKEVAASAIRLSREGVHLTGGQQRAFALLQPIFRRTPEAWRLIGHLDHVLEQGAKLTNELYSDFLGTLVEEGPEGFYAGEVAARIEEITEGFVTAEDLAAYEPAFGEPLSRTYRRVKVHTPGSPSLNGALLQVGLSRLEAGGEMPRFGELEYWRRIADALRVTEDVRTPSYEAQIFEDGFLEGVLASCPGGNTMQVSVVDKDGDAVSLTTTVGEGAGFTIPGTGVILNNFLGEEDILPDHVPHVPGRRMMTSMAPTLVEDATGGVLALGAAGSARIRSAIMQVLVHVLDSGMQLQQAVLMPRIHPDGDTIYIEAHGRTPEEVQQLHALGAEAVMTYEIGFFFGGVQAAQWTADRGFDAGAEIERRGCAARLA
ncbi:MAG: gamma-glutamyltransferase [Planctomycetota bacterium]|nr:gamma-glutamyltransferase [Planctomycetota bacterium]